MRIVDKVLNRTRGHRDERNACCMVLSVNVLVMCCGIVQRTGGVELLFTEATDGDSYISFNALDSVGKLPSS